MARLSRIDYIGYGRKTDRGRCNNRSERSRRPTAFHMAGFAVVTVTPARTMESPLMTNKPSEADPAAPSIVVPLRSPANALIARLTLISGAQRSLDLQYYLWDSDAVGYLYLSRLLEAADRGVAVRLLVDDLKLRSRTRAIASLCLHPSVEIKLFNPFRSRSNVVAEGIEFIRRFAKLDERMHNKLFVADGERAVLGGRNIAAEHFGLSGNYNFIDFDIELQGPDVASLSGVFESYWQNPICLSGTQIDPSVTEADLAATRSMIDHEYHTNEPLLAETLAGEDVWAANAASMAREVRPGAITVASDLPGAEGENEPIQVHEALRAAASRAQEDVIMVTPFFVPSQAYVDLYQETVDRGVRMRILTNSLASNPGTISNSGLNRQRRAVVEAGVELHELRTDAAVKPEWDVPPVVSKYLALHAKLYIIDRRVAFIGSLNLDPRSKYLNTEMGVLIDEADLAADAAEAILPLLDPENSWRVDVGTDGELLWTAGATTLDRQPARGRGQRTIDWVFSHLPIENYI